VAKGDQGNGNRKQQDSEDSGGAFETFGKRKGGSSLSYGDLNPQILARFVNAVITEGAALLLAITSDGGAYSMRIIEDKKPRTAYPSSVEEAEEIMQEVINS
jgi:hypothetical protein